ncbi:hypothetical protein ACTNEW_11810, partial [Blautia sp. HCP3S3_G3]|uniref:hypothetical protein n=1 Tax=Blautia sp. HCP3S3_G3 TaxID=3438913 RepID=UPI003F895AE6
YREMSIPMAPSSEIFIDDILKKSLIFKEKRLDLIGRNWYELKKSISIISGRYDGCISSAGICRRK